MKHSYQPRDSDTLLFLLCNACYINSTPWRDYYTPSENNFQELSIDVKLFVVRCEKSAIESSLFDQPRNNDPKFAPRSCFFFLSLNGFIVSKCRGKYRKDFLFRELLHICTFVTGRNHFFFVFQAHLCFFEQFGGLLFAMQFLELKIVKYSITMRVS